MAKIAFKFLFLNLIIVLFLNITMKWSLVTGDKSASLRGKAIYSSNCTSCHNPNPKTQGSIGPEIFSSSKELLVAKLIFGIYPDKYMPKRSTNIMPKFPHLKNDIDALATYLNEKD